MNKDMSNYRPDPTAPGAVIMNVADDCDCNWLKSKREHTLESALLSEIENFPGADEAMFNGSMRFNEPTLLFNYDHLRDKLDDLVKRRLVIQWPDDKLASARYFSASNQRAMHRTLLIDYAVGKGQFVKIAVKEGAELIRKSQKYVRLLLRDLAAGSDWCVRWLWLTCDGRLYPNGPRNFTPGKKRLVTGSDAQIAAAFDKLAK